MERTLQTLEGNTPNALAVRDGADDLGNLQQAAAQIWDNVTGNMSLDELFKEANAVLQKYGGDTAKSIFGAIVGPSPSAYDWKSLKSSRQVHDRLGTEMLPSYFATVRPLLVKVASEMVRLRPKNQDLGIVATVAIEAASAIVGRLVQSSGLITSITGVANADKSSGHLKTRQARAARQATNIVNATQELFRRAKIALEKAATLPDGSGAAVVGAPEGGNLPANAAMVPDVPEFETQAEGGAGFDIPTLKPIDWGGSGAGTTSGGGGLLPFVLMAGAAAMFLAGNDEENPGEFDGEAYDVLEDSYLKQADMNDLEGLGYFDDDVWLARYLAGRRTNPKDRRGILRIHRRIRNKQRGQAGQPQPQRPNVLRWQPLRSIAPAIPTIHAYPGLSGKKAAQQAKKAARIEAQQAKRAARVQAQQTKRANVLVKKQLKAQAKPFKPTVTPALQNRAKELRAAKVALRAQQKAAKQQAQTAKRAAAATARVAKREATTKIKAEQHRMRTAKRAEAQAQQAQRAAARAAQAAERIQNAQQRAQSRQAALTQRKEAQAAQRAAQLDQRAAQQRARQDAATARQTAAAAAKQARDAQRAAVIEQRKFLVPPKSVKDIVDASVAPFDLVFDDSPVTTDEWGAMEPATWEETDALLADDTDAWDYSDADADSFDVDYPDDEDEYEEEEEEDWDEDDTDFEEEEEEDLDEDEDFEDEEEFDEEDFDAEDEDAYEDEDLYAGGDDWDAWNEWGDMPMGALHLSPEERAYRRCLSGQAGEGTNHPNLLHFAFKWNGDKVIPQAGVAQTISKGPSMSILYGLFARLRHAVYSLECMTGLASAYPPLYYGTATVLPDRAVPIYGPGVRFIPPATATPMNAGSDTQNVFQQATNFAADLFPGIAPQIQSGGSLISSMIGDKQQAAADKKAAAAQTRAERQAAAQQKKAARLALAADKKAAKQAGKVQKVSQRQDPSAKRAVAQQKRAAQQAKKATKKQIQAELRSRLKQLQQQMKAAVASAPKAQKKTVRQQFQAQIKQLRQSAATAIKAA